jgi:hypothetical protein
MRRIAILVWLAALPAVALAQTPGRTPTPEQALIAIEEKWAMVPLKKDTVALESILAPGWTGISADGEIITRAQAIERSKASNFTRSVNNEMRVTLLDPTTAIVTGVWNGSGTNFKGDKIETRERWTDVFVNQNGIWKCVAAQSTTIKK